MLENNRNAIWNMEIDSYKEDYLEDFSEDTRVDFLYLHCEELYDEITNLRKVSENMWSANAYVFALHDESEELFNYACEGLKTHTKFITNYFHSSWGFEISIPIYENMSIYDAYNYILEIRQLVVDECYSIKKKTLSTCCKKIIVDKLPIYRRAMDKVLLELSNFKTDTEENSHKIVEVGGRVKEIDSIAEKVYRKDISQHEVFEKFDDIAGVRCTCEYLDDVYDVLSYIVENPMFNVLSIDDKIKSSSAQGYRGIHVIVDTEIYYQKCLHKNIKVEIQLRTAFQNAWSMKTHELTYKKEQVSKEIVEAMKRLSDTLNEADKTALEIKCMKDDAKEIHVVEGESK